MLAHWKEDIPHAINLLNITKDCLVIYLQIYNTFFLLRFILLWFPNINPFIQPYYIIRVFTQPFLDFIEERLPKLFGLDLSFLVCSISIQVTINFLKNLKL